MSLSSLLKYNADVRQRFREEFNKPQLKIKKEMLAPPLSTNYRDIGTAFDYLLRFYCKRLNSQITHDNPWKACSGYGYIQDEELFFKAQDSIETAKKKELHYLKTGRMTTPIVKSVLTITPLDNMYRSSDREDFFGTEINPDDIKDLKQLFSIINPNYFKAKKICILNPSFAKASNRIGGADADLIIDDNLIDIKTTKIYQFRSETLYQLIGYYMLNKLGGITGIEKTITINKLSIYYSRHGSLVTIKVKDLINQRTFPQFVHWFVCVLYKGYCGRSKKISQKK